MLFTSGVRFDSRTRTTAHCSAAEEESSVKVSSSYPFCSCSMPGLTSSSSTAKEVVRRTYQELGTFPLVQAIVYSSWRRHPSAYHLEKKKLAFGKQLSFDIKNMVGLLCKRRGCAVKIRRGGMPRIVKGKKEGLMDRGKYPMNLNLSYKLAPVLFTSAKSTMDTLTPRVNFFHCYKLANTKWFLSGTKSTMDTLTLSKLYNGTLPKEIRSWIHLAASTSSLVTGNSGTK
ncbi:hypothetical protein ZIOFF_074319 (mitochondrion) [Zingiber officinale]|uniref:Uncharacterized protein n=1 Tax=Zingiber officinale TaxID=94328 RepID=A0A8J5ELP0_ZINOF|nr:hypothetical protein ZIOFF_074319 [Zingiber officinale]